jgi:hypothetical protein
VTDGGYRTFRSKAEARDWLGEGGKLYCDGSGREFAYIAHTSGVPGIAVVLCPDPYGDDGVAGDYRRVTIDMAWSDFDRAWAVCRAWVMGKEV